jgi:hypothetical protein
VTISKREFGCVAFSVFLAVPALAQTRQGEPPSLTDALPLHVSVRHPSGWEITFVPSGGAHLQYGSTFGDGGEVPAGTVDYAALVKSLSKAPATTALPPAPIDSKSLRAPRAPLFQVGFRWPCAESFSAEQCASYGRTATGHEQDVLERLLVRLNRQWKARYGSSERLKELLRRYPIVSKEKQKDEPSLKQPFGKL